MNSPRIQQSKTRTRFLKGKFVNKLASRSSAGPIPMISSSPSVFTPSPENFSFPLTKFERRSTFSRLSLESFRSLIISTRYDCIFWVNPRSWGTNAGSSSQSTYPEFRKSVSSLPDLLGGRPLEKPLRTKEPDEESWSKGFYRPFEAQFVPRRWLIVFPSYLMPKYSSRDYHKDHLGRFVNIFSQTRTALPN